MEYYTETEVLRELREKAEHTGQSELSRKIGITPQLMCDVLKERRWFGSRVLEYLGYEQVTAYVRKRRSRSA